MADTDDRVELTDLDVIARYSLAVRAATADRHELIATLRADLEWLQGGRTRRTSAASAATTPARRTPPSAPAAPVDRRAPAVKKATAKKATSSRSTPAVKTTPARGTAKKAPAKKSPAKKTTRR